MLPNTFKEDCEKLNVRIKKEEDEKKLTNDLKNKILYNILQKIKKDEQYAFLFFIHNYQFILPLYENNKNYFCKKDYKNFNYKGFGLNLYKSMADIELNENRKEHAKIKINNDAFVYAFDIFKEIKQYDKNGIYVNNIFQTIRDFYFVRGFVSDYYSFEELIKKRCPFCKYYILCDKGNNCLIKFEDCGEKNENIVYR